MSNNGLTRGSCRVFFLVSRHESASALGRFPSLSSCHVIEKDRGRRSGDQRPAAGRTPRPRGPLLAAAGRGRPPHAPTAAARRASRRPPCAPPQLPPPAAPPLPSSLPGAVRRRWASLRPAPGHPPPRRHGLGASPPHLEELPPPLHLAACRGPAPRHCPAREPATAAGQEGGGEEGAPKKAATELEERAATSLAGRRGRQIRLPPPRAELEDAGYSQSRRLPAAQRPPAQPPWKETGRKLEEGAGEGGVPSVAAPPLTACPRRRDKRGRNGHHGRPGCHAVAQPARRRRCGGERPSSAPSPPPYRRPGPSSTVERAAPGHHRRRPRACRPCREKERLLEPKACAERERERLAERRSARDVVLLLCGKESGSHDHLLQPIACFGWNDRILDVARSQELCFFNEERRCVGSHAPCL